MPTNRPRYQVTETPQVARALDFAAQLWPGEPRSRLLVRLVGMAGDTLEQQRVNTDVDHATAVKASSGRYAGAFGSDYLTELRADWPA